VIVLDFVHVLLFIFLFSGCECNDLLFGSKCFFIIPLLNSHLDRYDTQNKSQADLWNYLLRVTVKK